MSSVSEPSLDRPASESNWGDFVDSYGRAILEWFRQTGLPPTDVEELVREMMSRLVSSFREVVSAPELHFRGWLQFAIHQAWGSVAEHLMDAGVDGSSPKLALLLSADAHDALLHAMDSECSHLRRRQILQRVRLGAEPADWEAFAQTVLDGNSPAAIAAVLGTEDMAVRAGAFRIHRLLHRDIRAMEELF